MNLLAHRSFGKCESAVISVQKFHKNANLLISAHRMLGIYFRLIRNEYKFRREVMQFLFIEFFLRCDTSSYDLQIEFSNSSKLK